MIKADDHDWQLPAFRVDEMGGKRHDHALVIQVINEGERIRAQLIRTAAAELAIDVVIADGGSTDGSLDPDFLRGAGVRALLTKTGPGKLSAQLRMAYAWCLRQGYEGVVTIDGNGKDNVEAVAQFIDRLRDGYDYVQGSRYKVGGKAENTPLERTIGNRLIHAPLLSLGGGHTFTDTTNGFRAYSARYLRDARVQPFRHEFDSYNLLFYLTVRAKRLDFRVTEVPVSRSYPAAGKTPTKIAGLSTRLTILSEALNAATGAYSPPLAPRQHDFPIAVRTGPLFAVLIAVLLAGFAYGLHDRTSFNPDSWSFYELARSIPLDFYRIHFVRQFWMTPGYSSAFPPLWPTLLFLVDRIAGSGAASGFYLAVLSSAVFVAASEQAGRCCFHIRWIGLAAALLVLSHGGFVQELLSGGTIPLQMTLYAIVLWVLMLPEFAARHPVRQAAVLGLLCGLALMNRFDALPFVVSMLLVLIFLTGSGVTSWSKLQVPLAYLVSVQITVSPWILYSRQHFHRWFATDNSRTALSADPLAYVTDWWPSPQPTLFDEPVRWLAKVALNFMRLFPAAFASPGLPALLLWLVVFAMIGGAAAIALFAWPDRSNQTFSGTATNWRQSRQSRAAIGALLAILSILPSYVLTGYFAERYFAPEIWIIAFLALGWLASRMANQEQRDLFGWFSAVVVLTATAMVMAHMIIATPPSPLSAFPRDREDADVERCLFKGGTASVLLGTDATNSARLSALYFWDIVLLPENFRRLTPAEARQFLSAYNIRLIDVRNPEGHAILGQKVELTEQPGCPQSIKGWR
ncbi:hypothetical protein BH10PSE13_BH10PSE13_11300 [soil metagenome]